MEIFVDKFNETISYFYRLLEKYPIFGEENDDTEEYLIFHFEWSNKHERNPQNRDEVIKFDKGSWWTEGFPFNDQGTFNSKKLYDATAVPSPEHNVKYFYIMKYYYDPDLDFSSGGMSIKDCLYKTEMTRCGREIEFFREIPKEYFIRLEFKDYYDPLSY